jgi:hypothetical protein
MRRYLLEEATLAEYADKIAAQLNKLTVTANSDPQSATPQLTSNRP